MPFGVIHAEVQVRTRAETGIAAVADDIAGSHPLPETDLNEGKVGVERRQPERMFNENPFPPRLAGGNDVSVPRSDNNAVGAGKQPRAGRNAEVNAGMKRPAVLTSIRPGERRFTELLRDHERSLNRWK